MALLWIDGFELYANSIGANISTLLGRRYSTISGTVTSGQGPYGGYCSTCTSAASFQTPSLTTNATLVVGVGCKTCVGLPSNTSVFQFYDNATLGIDVQWNPLTGEIAVYRNTTLLGTTSGAGVVAGAWYYIEVKVYCHASAGTVDVHVNGVSKLSLTTLNTKQGTDAFYNQVRFLVTSEGANPALPNSSLDNIYILDGSGSINNNLLGPCQVLGEVPASDSSVAWTPSSGSTHFNLVNEIPPDDDTTWVQGTTSGQVDLYAYTPYSWAGAVVIGVQINTTCRVTDANTFGLLMPVVSGAESDGTAQTISVTTYVDYRRIIETDPNTGSPWTQTALNAATFGVKVQ